MRISKFRWSLLVASLCVIGLLLSARIFGAGIATTVPAMDRLMVIFSMAAVTVEIGRALQTTKRLIGRIFIGLAVFTFGLATIVIAIISLIPLPENKIGEVDVHPGRLAAYLISVPLVDDFVRVDFERRILPGLYWHQTMKLIDPAWGATAQVTRSGTLLISYIDEDHQPGRVEVSR